MPIKHACFISYRRGNDKDRLTPRLITDLYNALTDEVGQYLEEAVYLDEQFLNGGQYVDKTIARALCESVCLIVVFTPRYLSSSHPYCARELCAMRHIEKRRFEALKLPEEKTNGLIITIVYRGMEELPDELKDRLCHNFEAFDERQPKLRKNEKYYPQIREIAKYIHDRYKSLNGLSEDPCGNCADFELPRAESEEVKTLLRDSIHRYVR